VLVGPEGCGKTLLLRTAPACVSSLGVRSLGLVQATASPSYEALRSTRCTAARKPTLPTFCRYTHARQLRRAALAKTGDPSRPRAHRNSRRAARSSAPIAAACCVPSALHALLRTAACVRGARSATALPRRDSERVILFLKDLNLPRPDK
jgi:hypothetical protein